jgi:hypothetical protein
VSQLSDEVPDLAEPIFDLAVKTIANEVFKSSLPEIVGELPILKYGKTAKDIFNIVNNKRRASKLRVFLQSLLTQELDIAEFHKLDSTVQNQVVEMLISEINTQSSDLQSEALAYLFTAYVNKAIDHLTFLGIAHELKYTNPALYNFSVDKLAATIDGEVYKVTGPTNYLPVSFGHNTITGIGQWSSTGDYFFVLSNFGKIFYNSVYLPMSERQRGGA